MHFLVKFRKRTVRRTPPHAPESVDPDLATRTAPSTPADRIHVASHSRFTAYLYLYDNPVYEEPASFLTTSEDGYTLTKGCCIKDEQASGQLTGDYLRVAWDGDGNGSVQRPKMSFHQLFAYEDAGCLVLASEISLVLLAVPSLASAALAEIYDYRFVYECITREWGPRTQLEGTFVVGVRRLMPHYTVQIRGGSLHIQRKPYQVNDTGLESLYLNKKDAFYERTLAAIERYCGELLRKFAGKNIDINLTGGLDSRLSFAILDHFRRKFFFNVTARTGGEANHPDVEIAQRLASAIGVRHDRHEPRRDERGNWAGSYPRTLEDYQRCFRIAQGDWNSNDFCVSVWIPKTPTVWGTDNYKRFDLLGAVGLNRFFARRIFPSLQLLLLSLDPVNEAACIAGKHNLAGAKYEFAFHVLRRFSPTLLDIPLVGCALPLHYVPPHKSERESKENPGNLAQAFFDCSLVTEGLSKIVTGGSRPKWRPLRSLHYRLRSPGFAPRFYRKIGLYEIDTSRKQRIAMDYASVASMTPKELFANRPKPCP
ncbi:MAG TPA: hypothetical protein PLQ85_00345 [Anaerolineae bacterium]|nr:hypothetical protein [Anaerolineae bacterium]